MSNVSNICDTKEAANSIYEAGVQTSAATQQQAPLSSGSHVAPQNLCHFLYSGALPVCGWVYHDPSGSPVFIETRVMNGKGGKGCYPYRHMPDDPKANQLGYVLGKKGVTPPLYRSHVIAPRIAANAQEVVYIPEGPKACDALVDQGLLATTNAFGAGEWKDEHSQFLATTGAYCFVLIADNDEPGRKHMWDVAKSLSQHIPNLYYKIVELPDLPEGGDVHDFFTSSGTVDQFVSIVNETSWRSSSPAQAPENVDVAGGGEESGDELPEPPLDVLPGNLAHYARSVAASFCVDSAMVLGIMMPIAASAIGRACDVQAKSEFIQPAMLWHGVIAEVGTMKTDVLKAVSAPITAKHLEFKKQYDLDHKNYAQALAKANAASKDNDEEADAPDEPIRLQAVVSDTTTEALAQVLEHSPRILNLQDELKQFFALMGCYGTSRTSPDRTRYLKLYNGIPITVNRSKEQAKDIECPRMSIVGGIQPKVAKQLHSDDEGDGLLERFSFIMPTERAFKKDAPAIPQNLEMEWHSTLNRLFDLPVLEKPRRVYFTPEAWDYFGTWCEDHDPVKAPVDTRAIVAKLRGNIVRLALVLQLLATPTASSIPVSTVKDAIRLGEWLAAHTIHARTFMAGGYTSKLSSRAERILKHIKKHKHPYVTPSDVVRLRIPTISDVEEACTVLRELESVDAGLLEEETTLSGNVRKVFNVNPSFTTTS